MLQLIEARKKPCLESLLTQHGSLFRSGAIKKLHPLGRINENIP